MKVSKLRIVILIVLIMLIKISVLSLRAMVSSFLPPMSFFVPSFAVLLSMMVYSLLLCLGS